MGNKPASSRKHQLIGAHSQSASKQRYGDHFRDQMVPCESHPDVHVNSCSNCYRLSIFRRLTLAAARRFPGIGNRKKEGYSRRSVDTTEEGSVSLISFRSSEVDDDRSWGALSPASSKSSALSGRSSLLTNSSTGSHGSSKRWNRGRCQKRWQPLPDSRQSTLQPRMEFKTAWPISLKESLFLPEFPAIPALMKSPGFEIISSLSSGKFSKVSRIRMRNTGEEFALKQMAKLDIIRTHAVEQVKAEAAIQQSLLHPFLLTAAATWQTRSHLYIVTEYAAGGDLYALWSEFGAFAEPVVQIWGAEIGLGLKHLHNNGIIYRDLKLQNILIGRDGHIKLSDFGLARFIPDDTRTMTICGTLDCMAPEVLQGEPYGFAADWWSFGVNLYALLLGRYPILPEENHILMAEKVKKHMYLVSDGEMSLLSPAAGNLLLRLLRKDPRKRLQDFQTIRSSGFFCSLNFAHVYRKLVCPFAFVNYARTGESGTLCHDYSHGETMQYEEFYYMD